MKQLYRSTRLFILCCILNLGITSNIVKAQAPIITSFSPDSGNIGSLVTIKGTKLLNPTNISIGGVNAIKINSNDTILTVLVMPGTSSGLISISNSSGTSISNINFQIKSNIPPNFQQGNKLVGGDGSGISNIYQGCSVSISADGNTVIVGGDGDNNSIGAAWIYTRNGNLWSQQGNKLVGTGSIGAARQGCSVSISADGNTAIVGGSSDNSNQGAAWIFTRSGTTWTQQGSKLFGSGGLYKGMQGSSVSLSADGNTAIISGIGDMGYIGAVWIFVRNGNTWTQQGSKLVGTGNTGKSFQGSSVCLSADGNTAAVGGYGDSSYKGAVWIFVRNGNTWTQQGSKLIGIGSVVNSWLGSSISLSADGNTVVVGGYYDNNNLGAVWVFVRNGTTWTQQGNKLVGTGSIGAARQGCAVSISADGNTILVGGNGDNNSFGAAWIYTRNGNLWTQKGNKLVSSEISSDLGFSASISADGSSAIIGERTNNLGIGAARVFTNQPTIIKVDSFLEFNSCKGIASDVQSFKLSGINLISYVTVIAPVGFEVSLSSINNFNNSLNISPLDGVFNDTLIYLRLNSNTPGVLTGNITINSIGAFVQTIATKGIIKSIPTITSFIPNKASIGSLVTILGNNFNNTTKISFGNISQIILNKTSTSAVVMVMPGTVSSSINITTDGCVAVSETNFDILPTKVPNYEGISKISGNNSSQIGYSVSLSADGTTAILGSPGQNNNGGGAWIYIRDGNTWTKQGNLSGGNIGAAKQGTSVSISADGNTAIVGGSADNSNQGAAWIYIRNGNIWTQQIKLVGSGNVGAAQQGCSVSISADGNTAIVGGLADDNNKGAVWIFTRSSTTWTQQGNKLVGTGGLTLGAAKFGCSVSVSADGNTAIVGGCEADGFDGSAWIFTRNNSIWTQQGNKLKSSSTSIFQGISVSISADGNTAIVGSSGDNINLAGAAWVYSRNGDQWTQYTNKLICSDITNSNLRGYSVSLSADGNTALIGCLGDSNNQGASWLFKRIANNWIQQSNKLIGNDKIGSAQQGFSVSISANGNTALVGGFGDNSNNGAVWTYSTKPQIYYSGSLLPFKICNGNVSGEQNFKIRGLNLQSNIIITAPFGFEISNKSGVGFTNTLTISQSESIISDTNIFVRLIDNTLSSSNPKISITSNGDTLMNIDISVLNSPPIINSFTPTNGSVGSIVTLNGSNLNNTTSVTFGSISAIVLSSTNSNVNAMIMPGTITDKISISTSVCNTTSLNQFKIISSDIPKQQQGNKLTSTAILGSIVYQGGSVSISADGNTAIVGGLADNGNKGAAWIYIRNGNTWSQQVKLVGTGNVGAAQQGYSVSISADGNTAIVGGLADNSNQGAAWIFTRTNNSWSQQGNKLVGTGNIGAAKQGCSVSISADGNTAIVGGSSDNSNQGAAWIFTRANNSWSQQGNKLVCTLNNGKPNFGCSVSISADGKNAVIGGISDYNYQGGVWIFTLVDNLWLQQARLSATNGVGGNILQGSSVSISANGNTIIYGARGDNNGIGAAWVFNRNSNIWNQEAKLIANGIVGSSIGQGISVSLSSDGNTAVLGGYNDNNGQGASWIFKRLGGVWIQQGNKLLGSGNTGAAQQGISVSISAEGNTAIVGGNGDKSGTGAAWIFSPSPAFVKITSNHPTYKYLKTNTSNNIIACYQITDSISSSILNSLKLTTLGNFKITDIKISSLKCWFNYNTDLTSAIQIGSNQTIVNVGEEIIFNNLSQKIPVGQSYIFITCDISTIANGGNTIGITSIPVSNFVFSDSITINDLSNIPASNLLTINEVGPVKMQYRFNNIYKEDFTEIDNWTNGFTEGFGSSKWSSVVSNAGSIPSASAVTVSSTNFQTSSSSAGIQRGNLTGNVSGTLAFLTLGNLDNTSSVAVDFLLDYTNRNADSLIFDAATVFNGVGNRNSTLRVYWTIDSINYTELTGINLPYVATNNVANSGTIRVKLPAAFNNISTCRLRFYYHNGTGGTSSSRPKISIDNVQVSAVCPIGSSTTNINSCTPYTWNGQTYNSSGVYYKTLIGASKSGCDSIATLNLNINSLATFNPFQDTIKACGNSFILNAGNDYTSYLWNTGATSSTISSSISGWYNVTVSNGTCTASDSTLLSLVSIDIINNDTIINAGTNVILKVNGTGALQNQLTYLWSNGLSLQNNIVSPTQNTTYFCTVNNGLNSCIDSVKIGVNVKFKLKLYLEAFYENGRLKSSLNNADGNSDIGFSDTIQIQLFDTINNTIVYSINTILDTAGLCQIFIPSMFSNKSFYLIVKHRSSIETWSSTPITFDNGILYDFTSSKSKAYGDNLKNNGNDGFLIYGGDINQDGFIDGNDFINVDNDNSFFVSGYTSTDVNGDGFVDGNDFIVIDNNNSNFIGVIRPF